MACMVSKVNESRAWGEIEKMTVKIKRLTKELRDDYLIFFDTMILKKNLIGQVVS